MAGLFFPKDEPNPVIQADTLGRSDTTWGDVGRTAWDSATRRNMPVYQLFRTLELEQAKTFLDPNDKDTTDLLTSLGYDEQYINSLKEKKVLTKEEANAQYGIQDRLTFTEDRITEDAARIIRKRKEEELQTEQAYARTHGAIKNIAAFGT
jgi:hypothetical protein